MQEDGYAGSAIAPWGAAEDGAEAAGPQVRPGEDPGAAWERYKLQVAVHDRETDLAEARRSYHSALDDRARLMLEAEILRGAVNDREVDLAEARRELHEALDRAGHLALERDMLRNALSEREADIVTARRESQQYNDDMSRLGLKLQLLEEAFAERSTADASAPAEISDISKNSGGRLAEVLHDLAFFVKYMINVQK